MNLNSTGKKSRRKIIDPIKNEKKYYNTDKKNETNKKENDDSYSLDKSEISEEIKRKNYKNSDVKNNNKENESSNNNTFSYMDEKKYTSSFQKSINKTSIKETENLYIISHNKNNSFNNFISDTSSKYFFKKKAEYPTKLIKDYKFWKGNNFFPFKAHIIEGPASFRPTLMTATAITLGFLLFLIFESDFLYDEITIFIPILISLLYIAIMINLIIASFCDPGIIRKFDVNKYNTINQEKIDNKENNRIISRIFHLGHIMNYKYCYTCGIMRPNRSTHCSNCNNCVERLDHHCPWIGNCAGKRNYIYFFIFLTLLNLLQILVIIFCLIHILKQVKDFSDLNDKLPPEEKKEHSTAYSLCEVIMSLYLIIYNIFFMGFTVPLIIYHINFILTDITTKEHLRKAFYHGNPFKRNKIQNIKNILFPDIKKYSILDILRGDFKEICDNKKPDDNDENKNDLIQITNEENNKNQNQAQDETQNKLNINSIIDESINNLNVNKINDEPNLNFLNISESVKDTEENNKKEISEFKNKKIDQKKEPEPLDTLTENDSKKEEKQNISF